MDKLGNFQIVRLLGKGQFGETYEAVKGKQHVALKVIKEEAVQAGFDVRYFQREVKALQKVTGPNVVNFVEAGCAQLGNENRYYVAMEYLDGEDLAQAFKKSGKVFAADVLRNIIVQIVSGLESIHEKNIVHRDLKPANVFLEKTGTVKLLDFGLVKMLDYTTLATRPGQPIGTPLYMAPEILRGDRIDYRADFYSIGVLIFHLITHGNYPLIASTPIELYVKLVNNPPTSPTRYNQKISLEFENLVLTLLSKQPYERTFRHQELITAITSIPIEVSTIKEVTAKLHKKPYAKKCYFRLLQNEKSDVETFVKAGGKMDGFVFPANFLPRSRKSLETYNNLGLSYLFDPATYRLTYSSFALTRGLVELPYVLDKNNVLSPEDLQTLQSLQSYARSCIDWQLKWGCSILVAPFHYSQNLGSPWIDVDIKLIEEAISYVKSKKIQLAVYAGICTNIESFTVLNNRLTLLNRYSRARADGYLFYVDNLDERTNNPLQVKAYFELLSLFQKLGKPVFACRTGTLGLGLLAAGVDGISSGIASLSSFSEHTLLQNRSTGYDMSKKYYISKMMLTLPIEMARDILSDSRNIAFRCDCQHCQKTPQNLERAAKPHFLHVRTQEVSQLNGLNKRDKIDWFIQRVNNAIKNCDSVRRQQIVNLTPGYYSHLKTWLRVFSPVKGDST